VPSSVAPALEQLCRTYWFPLYAHVRRRGYSAEDAQDLTQEFFARLLAKDWLGLADPSRGRFRSFLLASLNHFLANEWHKVRAEKRGGNRTALPFDTVSAELLYHQEPDHALGPEDLYDRTWALQFLDHVRVRLREECVASGKAGRYETLERFLPGEEQAPGYAQVAAQIGLPEGTLKSEVHRLKKRYGELLRQEIAHTVTTPEEIDAELRYLIAVLGSIGK